MADALLTALPLLAAGYGGPGLALGASRRRAAWAQTLVAGVPLAGARPDRH